MPEELDRLDEVLKRVVSVKILEESDQEKRSTAST